MWIKPNPGDPYVVLIIEFPVVNVLSGGQWHLLLFVAGQPTLGYATVCLYFGGNTLNNCGSL